MAIHGTDLASAARFCRLQCVEYVQYELGSACAVSAAPGFGYAARSQMLEHADPEESGARLADRARQFEELARELRLIAGAIADRRGTVQPTALVNEAFLKLSNCPTCSWKDSAHFLRVAAVTMRSILLDHKRAREARKRGGGISHEPLDEAVHYLEESCGAEVEDVHRALSALAVEDQELAEFVSLRFFGGRSNVEAAVALGISERTGVRYWEFARAWLHRYLSK